MDRRLLPLTLVPCLSIGLTSCSWFQDDDGFQGVAAPPASGETPQVTPTGPNAVPPGAAGIAAGAGGNAYGAGGYATPAPAAAAAPGATATAPAAPAASAPIANEQFVSHTIVSGDSLWKLARTYKTSVRRISEVNGLTNDKILAGQTLTIPTTSPPPGAQIVTPPAAAPAAPTTPAPRTSVPTAITPPAPPSAVNPGVRPLSTTPPPVGPGEPVAIPRPPN